MYRIYMCVETGISSRAGHASPAGAVAPDPGGRAPQADPATYKSGQLKPEDAIGAGYTL